MKQRFLIFILCFSICIIPSCGTPKTETKNTASALTTVAPTSDEFLTEVGETPTINPNENKDLFVGEYNDVQVNNPMLEIQKNEDGTYKIEIGIYRLYLFEDCVGILNNNKIKFKTTFKDEELSGTIEVEGKVATVTFLGDNWSDFADCSSYQYVKTSDIPYDHYDEY